MRHSQCNLRLYTMRGGWTKGSDQFSLCETWSVNYEWYWEILYENFSNIAKVLWENSKQSRIYQNVFLYYILLPFMDAVFSEERELMKWVGIFQLGNFWVGILRGNVFSWGGVDGWEFFRGKFPRIMVSKVCLRLGWEREGAASSKFATFWGIKIFLKIRVKKDNWIQKRNQTLVPTM